MSVPAAEAREASADAAVRRAAVFVLLVIGAAAIYMAIELRPLANDGPEYFHAILKGETYVLAAPARRVVEWIRQTPVVVAMLSGGFDLASLTTIFSFSLALAPLAGTALCWFLLPAGQKWFFVFPLLDFCAGSLGAMATPFQEGPAAAAIFWPIFLFVLFRVRSPRTVDIALLLSVLTFVLHEAILFLGPILAITAWMRARDLPSRADRVLLRTAGVSFLAAALIQVDFIANSRYVGHGAGYVRGLFSGAWIVDDTGAFNLSAALGVAALAVVGVLALCASRRRGPSRRFGAIGVCGFAAAAAAALAYLWSADRMLDVMPQFRARNNALLLSFPLALAALVALKWPAKVSFPVVRLSAALCVVLAAVAALWQFNSVLQWSRALGAFRAVLAESSGFVEWADALDRMPPDRRRVARLVLFEWTASPMSLVLAPKGRVRAIVGTTASTEYRAFDPLDPAKLPRSRYWDITPYLAALGKPAGDREKQP